MSETITLPRAKVQLALETLENAKNFWWPGKDASITALRAALEQPEQATVKESLPVGQEEPEGGWQSAPSPQVTQRIADMPMSEYRRGVNDGFKLGLREGRIKAEDEMREQPEQEPVAMMWKVRKALALASAICDRVPNRWHHTHEIGSAEADIGDMVNAHPDGTHGYRLIQEAEAELVAYLTTPEAAPQRQPEQEPPPWSTRERFYEALDHAVENVRQEMRIKTVTVRRKDYDVALPIIDAYSGHVLVGDPPSREWRGLTEEELRDALRECPHDTVENLRVRWLYAKDFARAIEAALKERNA